MSTKSIWWKAIAEAAGREPITIEFQHEGGEPSLYAEAERRLLEKSKQPGLVSSAPRSSKPTVVGETLAALGYRIVNIEAIDAA